MTFTNLGGFLLFDVDEAVFSQASKEMLLSKDLINPTYNGLNRYDKPILIYWLMSLSYALFGVSEFSARLTSAVSGIILCIVLFIFVKRHTNPETGIYALLVFAFSIYYFIYSRAAVTDMLLTLFISLALFNFYFAKKVRQILLFHLFCALAFLTKGLIGVVFPYGISICYIIFTRQWYRLRLLFNPLGILVFLVVAMPWYIAQYQRNGMEFIQQFFFKHHFQRYTDVISGHKGPFYYYLITLLIGMSPWILFLPSGIKRGYPDKTGIGGFALVWFAFVFVFFSLSTTKLPNYILPCIPAVAILIAISMKEHQGNLVKIILTIGAVAMFISTIFILPKILERFGISDIRWLYLIGFINLFSIGLFWIRFKQESLRYVSIALCMFLIFIIVSIKGLPLASEVLQGDLYRFSQYAREKLNEDERIMVYKINHPSIVFYSDRRVIRVGAMDEAREMLDKVPYKLLITRNRFKEDVIKLGFRERFSGREYALFER
ncbi:MAG: glycosyltransferase family 39 protein [Thermodesulfovibrionales bacterium]